MVNVAGRPTKYKEGYIDQAYDLCADGGFTDQKLANFFKVDKATIERWKLSHPEFCDSIKKGKQEFDTDKVEDSLLKQAIGYKVKEKTEEFILGADGKPIDGTKKSKTVTKHVVVPTSTYFWLKNRNPKRWRDIKAMEISGPDGGPLETSNTTITGTMTDKEAAALYAQKVKGIT